MLDGVIRTRVGYAGGQTHNPDYGNIGDHTETVQVDFDPVKISYEELLAFFWKRHRPGERTWSRQYMNAVFYHDEQQKQSALDSKARLEGEIGHTVHTQVLPLRSFTLAEDYHQKYLLRRASDLMRELRGIYPTTMGLVNSTAAARLNGYVGGYGNMVQLKSELALLGISAASQKNLVDLVGRSGKNIFN